MILKLMHEYDLELNADVLPKKFVGLGLDLGFGFKNFWIVGLGLKIFGFWVWYIFYFFCRMNFIDLKVPAIKNFHEFFKNYSNGYHFVAYLMLIPNM